jgi:CheY-like chemotaxis protein
MRILIVDDDEDLRAVLGQILRAAGHVVDEAADGRDALERLNDGARPGLILLDMMMPRLDGEGFLKAIRGDPRVDGTIVFVISGNVATRERAEELGAAGCFVKPVEVTDLMNVVEDAAADR